MNKKLERMKAAAARESAAERFITLPNNSGQDPEQDRPKRGRPKRTEAPEYFRMNLSGRKDYITVMASAMEALNDLKEEYAMERYLKHWAQLYPEEEEEVYYRFPFRFFEDK